MPLCRRRGDKGEEIRREGGKGRERESDERYERREICGERYKEIISGERQGKKVIFISVLLHLF